jgi:hypothetical protein
MHNVDANVLLLTLLLIGCLLFSISVTGAPAERVELRQKLNAIGKILIFCVVLVYCMAIAEHRLVFEAIPRH